MKNMTSEIKVADEVWVACALLHTENPSRTSFSNSEILDRVKKEAIADKLRVGIQWHIGLHCVANKPANPDNHRMLYELPNGTKRLFKSTDDYHYTREDGKTLPNPWEIPEKYRKLLQWYKESYDKLSGQTIPSTNNPSIIVDPPTIDDPSVDSNIEVTFTKFSNEHQMMDFAYPCPENISSIDIRNGACKKCSNFLTEDEVKKALAKSLKDLGWKVNKMAMGTKHGVDIEATQSKEGTLIIEAKGEGSLNPMRVNYFVMILGELMQKMDSPDKQYGIALPAHQQYMKLIHKLPLYQKQQLRLQVFLVKRVAEHNYAVGHFAYQAN
jgi:hypothetical protein